MGVGGGHFPAVAVALAMNAITSDLRHAVHIGPILIGLGKRPSDTHRQIVAGDAGMIGSIGGLALRSPVICLRRRSASGWGAAVVGVFMLSSFS